MAAKLNIDPETKFGMWISFYEIYNDNIFDLLYAPTKNKDEKRVPLKIREEMKNRIPYVEGKAEIQNNFNFEIKKNFIYFFFYLKG